MVRTNDVLFDPSWLECLDKSTGNGCLCIQIFLIVMGRWTVKEIGEVWGAEIVQGGSFVGLLLLVHLG